MDRRQLNESVQALENLLVARATGGTASDSDYRLLREELLAEPSLRELLPRFLRTARDLSQFWAEIKRDFGGYAERREFIWNAFRPAHEFLELPEGTPAPPVDAGESLASVVPAAPEALRPSRAFVSYSTKDKRTAGTIRDLLTSYGIRCFVAHDDLEVSQEWKEEILEKLLQCDIFVPLLSAAFRESDWAAQEIGVVSGRRGVAVVPLSLDGTVPFGFISSIQGKRIPQDGPTAELVIYPLLRKFPHLVLPGLIERVAHAGSFRGAEAAMRPLVPYFTMLTDAELNALVDAAIENNQVWSAAECRAEHLPALIEHNRARIPPPKLRALEYQVEHDQKYYPDDEA